MIKTGRFRVRLYGADGLLTESFAVQNGMTMQGLNASLAVELGGGTQVNPWYMGLIDNAGFSAISINDTMASHVGWAELIGYSNTTREALAFGTPAGGIIGTPNYAEFTINDTVKIKGIFLASVGTKGDATGILRAHGIFSSVQNRVAGQFMRVSYQAQNTAG
jgi:hypothetical protein